MGLLERLGLTTSEPKSEEEVRVEKVRVLEAEAHAAREREPPGEHIRLSCGHRTVRQLRPGQPRPPPGLCEICQREALEVRAGGRAPFAPEDNLMLVDAERGRLDSRRAQRWPRDWEARTARWVEERQERGELLSPEAEQTALSRIEHLRKQEAEEERLRSLSPEERAERARAIHRQQRGLRGGMTGSYQPSPARCGRG